MKKLFLVSLLFFATCLTAVAQYNITSLPNITLTFTNKQYIGKYVGEVNAADQPNGYGLFTFKESEEYYIGTFVNGQATGQGVKIDAKNVSLNIAERVNGLRKGAYFSFENKDLNYQKDENGFVIPIRLSSFYDDSKYFKNLFAKCFSGTTATPISESVFSINTLESISPNVTYVPNADPTKPFNSAYVQYEFKNNAARVMRYYDGKSNNSGWPYGYLDPIREIKLTENLGEALPYWLKDAMFLTGYNEEYVFMKTPQSLGQNTAYGMATLVNANTLSGKLIVSSFNNLLKPVGFEHSITILKDNIINYRMGNFPEISVGNNKGLGILAELYKSKYAFTLLAGNTIEDKNGTMTLNHGFAIVYNENKFRITIGDFENNTAMGSGYYIIPSKQLFFRGAFDNSYMNAIGEGVIDGNIKPDKYKLENNKITFLNQVPTFNRITESDLFNVPFDTDVK